jgi:hypothetical protein
MRRRAASPEIGAASQTRPADEATRSVCVNLPGNPGTRVAALVGMSADLIIELPHPERMSRAHLVVRMLIGCITGGILHSVGWPGGFLYLALPALAAILLSQHGADRYLGTDVPVLVRVLDWVMSFYAYMALLTDDFPLGDRHPVRYALTPGGAPTVRTAVLRILTSLPAALVLLLFGFVAALLGFFAWCAILFVGHYPRAWFDFQCGVLRFQARLLAYHASIVDAYPPISLELGPSGSLPTAHAM